jgi:hypothetical protein
MNEAVTLGMVFWTVLALGGAVLVLAILVAILTALGNAFKD